VEVTAAASGFAIRDSILRAAGSPWTVHSGRISWAPSAVATTIPDLLAVPRLRE